MDEFSRKISVLGTKLSGASTYPKWIISIEKYLDLIPVAGTTHYRVWDVVTGSYAKPVEDPLDKQPTRNWKDADIVAHIAIRKNCNDNVRARISHLKTSKEVHEELKKAYEGPITIDFSALYNSLTSINFDHRKTTIEEHIATYERAWYSFVETIRIADFSTDDGFGSGLKAFAGSDRAKTEFLLNSLPPFYIDVVENIRTKDYGYSDAVRKLKQYVPARRRRN